MKRAFFFFTIALCAISLKAQDSIVYRSIFGDSLTVWYDYAENIHHGSTTLVMGVREGDSCMIGGQKYYRLKPMPNTNSDIDHYWYNSLINGNSLFIRESDNNDKVFLLFKTGDTSFIETTLMDLNLNVGDTLPSLAPLAPFAPNGYAINKTVIVDSVLYNDGLKTIYTNLYHQTMDGIDTLKFIEGVGPTLGILYSLLFSDNERFYLRCQEKDSVLNFHSEIDCWWGEWFENVQKVDNTKPTISPNPTRNTLFINNLPETNWHISLYSVQGTPLMELSGSGKEERLDLSFLPSGTYHLTIRYNENIFRKKIIKQ